MKDKALLKAVFDCNVLLQAASGDTSSAAECLRLIEKGLVQHYLSSEVLKEVEDVLSRPEIRDQFKSLTDDLVQAFLLRLGRNSTFVNQILKKFTLPRDPDDESYLNLAIAADADFIVTRDNDLLDLMTGHTDEAKEFRQRYKKIKIVKPVEFRQAVREMDLPLNS